MNSHYYPDNQYVFTKTEGDKKRGYNYTLSCDDADKESDDDYIETETDDNDDAFP